MAEWSISATMVIVVACILALVTVPLAGGRLTHLAAVEVRHGWTVALAIALQVLAFSVFPQQLAPVGEQLHVATYALAAGFLVANRHIPGLWLVGLGAVANFAAIAANGGVMPATPSALRAAGLAHGGGEGFANSAAVPAAKLDVLGDVFAVPASWPLSNVFSIGDVCIVVGLLVVLHALSRSRLVPPRTGQFRVLLRERRFVRVWGAQTVSNLGDSAYSLAVAVSTIAAGHGAGMLATILVVQAVTAVGAGLLGGVLADRLPRGRLMIAADLARAGAVGSLLVAGTPDSAHLVAVAACLGAFGALFQPALHASLPNLVPRELLAPANAAVSATFHVSVLAGPVLGGLLTATLGAQAAFSVNAASFLVSALLLTRVRIPQARVRSAGGEPSALRALRDGLGRVAAAPVLRVTVAVVTAAMFAASLKQPLEPGFVLDDLGGTARDIGLLTGAWGLGMVLGSASAPSLERHRPRERLIAAALCVMGLALALAALAASVAPLMLAWLAGGAANGVLNVAYETLLQDRTPDRVRGRVLAAAEAGMDTGLVVGLGLSAVLADLAGARPLYLLAAAIVVGAGLAARRWLPVAPFLAAGGVEQIEVGGQVLLRVTGRWQGGPAVGEVVLAVDAVRLRPLPDPGAPSAGRWRAAFATDAATLTDGTVLALLLADGSRTPLPPPVRRTLRTRPGRPAREARRQLAAAPA